MKLNAGFVTPELAASKAFYLENFGFRVVFENEFYLLLKEPDSGAELSFLLPNHPTQHPAFQPAYPGAGAYLTLEVENADEWSRKLKARNLEFIFELRDEPWGDRHFAVRDPSGLALDVVAYSPPQ